MEYWSGGVPVEWATEIVQVVLRALPGFFESS